MTLEELRYFSTSQGRALLSEVSTSSGDDLAKLTALRKQFLPELCRAGLNLDVLRKRGSAKFSRAQEMVFDREALEQASGEAVSTYRSHRYNGIGLIGDICCGMGGDSIALARIGDVVSVDRDPSRAGMARWNVSAYGRSDRHRVVVANAEEWLPRVDAIFMDPGRRSGTRRIHRLADYQPQIDLDRLLSITPNVGIKVAPGISYSEIPGHCETEFISDSGSCKEAVLWFGELRTQVARRATVLPQNETLEFTDTGPADVKKPGSYLYEPDRAVIRAHLIDQLAHLLGAWKLDEEIAYLSSDVAHETPFAMRHRILDVFPFSLKRLQAHLRDSGVGRLDIKKRRFPMTPEQLRAKLKLQGEAHASIVVTRIKDKPTVLVCEAK
jgi:hypothetical protein